MKVPEIQVGVSDNGYGNDIRMGLVAYRDQFANWSLRNTGKLLRPFPSGKLDGAVVAIQSEDLKERWVHTGVPLVNVSSSLEDLPFPSVLIDNVCVGQIAADHFLERQFENFAYVGRDDFPHSVQRERGFREKLEQLGGAYFRYEPVAAEKENFLKSLLGSGMSRWLKTLPKPCAIFCLDDAHAVRLLDRILQDGWEVPAQIALLGVNNDEVRCSFARRPLSSVIINGREIGYRAGELLHRLMESGSVDEPVQYVRPIRVAGRISTDITAHNDEVVARALQFIRNNITQPIFVQDVAKGIGVSKRLLERQFSRHLEHGPAEEITRQRMRRAKHLLANTEWPVYKVAQACGYSDYPLFSTNFSRREGISPKRWRRRQAVRESK